MTSHSETVLSGHTNAETAYLVADYPYGFRLRCQIRYWIEHKTGHGFRFVSQTTNPKKAGTVWNKPKASTYAPFVVLVRTAEGHVETRGLGTWATPQEIDAAEAAYAAALTDAHRAALRYLRALHAAAERVTWTVRPCDGDRPGPSHEDTVRAFGAVVAEEYRKIA